MDRFGRRTLSSFPRVQEILSHQPSSNVPEGLGAQAAELENVVAQLTSESVDQEAGVRFGRAHTEHERKLRDALCIEHTHPVSLLGMTLSSLNPTVYGFLDARVDFHRSRSTYQ